MDDPNNSMFSGRKGQTEVTVMLDKKKNSVTLMTIIHKWALPQGNSRIE